jgi:dihydrodipicolinate synthase/N-acetylneuraminate lyase
MILVDSTTGKGVSMTPDDHYIRAEQLADQAAGTFQMILDAGAQRPIDADIRAAWFAEMGVLARLAQVHATLATRTAPAPAYPAADPYQGQQPPPWSPPPAG